MIPRIPQQRKFANNDSKPFNDLISYIEGEDEIELGTVPEAELVAHQNLQSSKFNDLLNYATNPTDKNTKADKCIAIRTHGVANLKAASSEMNAVALRNTRCKDPAYHFILSWPEHEKPASDAIFDAAENAIKALGLAEHQYVIAIHGNTDNMHCHVSVNRVHPITFKAQHIEFAVKSLHLAARQSEIKHGWTHDNGIYIVEVNGHGKKLIVLNPEHRKSKGIASTHTKDESSEDVLPSWHDPDSLESWLKTRVAKALKQALPELSGWYALHTWLSRYEIKLADTGGGGMRLHITSPESGEILDIPVSKGLRLLKRDQLEKAWGPFTRDPVVAPILSDLKHLTSAQLTKGITHVLSDDPGAIRPPTAILARNGGLGRPPEHVLRVEQYTEGNETKRTGGLHDVPVGSVDAQRQDRGMLLQDTVSGGLGDDQTGEDQDVRRPGAGETSSRREGRLKRDDSKREQRKQERADALSDLRDRFAKYRRFVQAGDTGHFLRVKELQGTKTRALKEIRAQSTAAKFAIPKGTGSDVRLISNIVINEKSLRSKLLAETVFQEKIASLKAIRTPPLSWRAWLYEQANLADQAALSALRGIVYQAQRDAKKTASSEIEQEDSKAHDYQEKQFRRVMSRLLEEEKKEAAIRSANASHMRAYEADALLASYVGIKWRVTGNGNVEFSKSSGDHLFTDRGNRLTFDRVRVTDQEIRLALAHAETKFGNKLTLTGDDLVFTKRMAKLADDMGITILNPDLQIVIKQHRDELVMKSVEAVIITEAVQNHALKEKPPQAQNEEINQAQGQIENIQQSAFYASVESASLQETQASNSRSTHDRLRDEVLSIDPRATFVIAEQSNENYPYIGLIAAITESKDGDAAGFAQHTGRGIYALHATAAPLDHSDGIVEVIYRNGQPVIKAMTQKDGQGRVD